MLFDLFLTPSQPPDAGKNCNSIISYEVIFFFIWTLKLHPLGLEVVLTSGERKMYKGLEYETGKGPVAEDRQITSSRGNNGG